MSYEKTTWATGDVITAEKLNKIEDGIPNADISIIDISVLIDGGDFTVTSDVTYTDAVAMFDAGNIVIGKITISPGGMVEVLFANKSRSEILFKSPSFDGLISVSESGWSFMSN